MRWLKQWGPVLAWASLIWIFSTRAFSAASTAKMLLPMLRWLLPQTSPTTIAQLHFAIRKTAHFIEYAIFSLLLLRGIRGERKGWLFRWGLVAVAAAACYALLDEAHQAFVPGRTASLYDSLLDTCGAVAAQLLAWVNARRQARSPARDVERPRLA